MDREHEELDETAQSGGRRLSCIRVSRQACKLRDGPASDQQRGAYQRCVHRSKRTIWSSFASNPRRPVVVSDRRKQRSSTTRSDHVQCRYSVSQIATVFLVRLYGFITLGVEQSSLWNWTQSRSKLYHFSAAERHAELQEISS